MNVLGLLYFMLPAYFSNMAPVILAKLFGRASKPLDLGYKYGGKRILGSHKTIRGLIGGTIIGTIIFFIQQKIYLSGKLIQISIINYSEFSLLLGILLSFGALIGDSIKSFFKRRRNVNPGAKFIPFDQIDYLIGAIMAATPIYFIGWTESIVVIITSFILTILVKHIGYYTGIGDEKW